MLFRLMTLPVLRSQAKRASSISAKDFDHFGRFVFFVNLARLLGNEHTFTYIFVLDSYFFVLFYFSTLIKILFY